MVDAPRALAPLLLGHQQRDHQRLEHRAAPGRHEVHAGVAVVALVDALAQVRPRHALGLLLLPVVVAVGGIVRNMRK